MNKILKEDITTPFNPKRFSIYRKPQRVGRIGRMFGCMSSCLDMLIKTPNGDLTLPTNYSKNDSLKSFINQSLAFEDAILPTWRNTHFAYLTVDQRIVQRGDTHGPKDWRFDGMQDNQYNQKLNACHQYICSSTLPKEYNFFPINMENLSEVTDDWFEKISEQIPEEAVSWSPRPYDILGMSAYQIRRNIPAIATGMRTFVNLNISLLKPNPV